MEENSPLEGKMRLVSAGVPVCFSCGRQGYDVLEWTFLFHFFRRGGRWMSGMANIGPHGLRELD